MSLQTLFTKVYEGLKSQGWKQSLGGPPLGDLCAYRGQGGRKCAAGWVISDEEYDPAFEGEDVCRLKASCVVPSLKELSEEEITFLRELQLAHDRNHVPENMHRAFLTLASKCHLKVPS